MTTSTSPIRPLVAGNWKMNGVKEAISVAETVASKLGGASANADVMICPPATLIGWMKDRLSSGPVSIGGQDCHTGASGAHTGDISAEMLADAGATAVIVGHSERRSDHGETSVLVREKSGAAYRAGLTAIICIGETAGERAAGLTLKVVARQLRDSVPDGATAANTVIAYEPVWAIGTGLTPTPEDVRAVHAAIRHGLTERFGEAGNAMRILYGGSVKPGNAKTLMAVENVDGALVGGASLKADDFLGIVAAYS